MSLLNNNIWEVSGLPKGLSCNGGVISGTPTEKGIFSVPVTVTNSLGSSSKTIKIITRYRPGIEKFSILQGGVEIEKVTIPQLQKMVQDGTAQEKYNCTNTQIVLPITVPELLYADKSNVHQNEYDPSMIKYLSNYVQNVAVNFCSFRDVTLQDGSTKPALILQFDKCLWSGLAPFDMSLSDTSHAHNRWKYSHLRRWLNSSGLNWFSPAFDGDEIFVHFNIPATEYNAKTLEEKVAMTLSGRAYNLDELTSTYADKNISGFLDCLPYDLISILQPIKVQTQVQYNEDDSRFEEPDFINGEDVDITYDKVFIPSLEEMYIDTEQFATGTPGTGYTKYAPSDGIEGEAWEYYINMWGTKNPMRVLDDEGFYGIISSEVVNSFGNSLSDDIPELDTNTFYPKTKKVITRSFSKFYYVYNGAVSVYSGMLVLSIYDSTYRYYLNARHPAAYLGLDIYNCNEDYRYSNPAPAFAIC